MCTTKTAPAATNLRPRVGQIVEFVTNHPSARGQTVRGRVDYVGTTLYPCNPSVVTDVGGVELLARMWGKEVRVISEP